MISKSELKILFEKYPKGQYKILPFFIVYINDIANSSNILLDIFVLFPDDTTILYSSETIVNEVLVINKELFGNKKTGLRQMNYLLK